MYKYRFSIFTATHNRSKSLLEISKFILNQSFKDSYEWVIVNDGSTDDTDTVVRNNILPKASIHIQYICKENGGKHTAWRVATQMFNGKYIITCDDDDPISYNMLEVFDKYWKQIENSNLFHSIWEVRARCCYENGLLIGPHLSEPYLDISYNDLVYKSKCHAEMLACRKVDVLRNEASVPEHFLFEELCTNFPEGVRWSMAGNKYISRIVPDILRTYIVGHESLCNSIEGRRSLKRNYNSLVSSLYSINNCGSIIRERNFFAYIKLIFLLAYSSVRVNESILKYVNGKLNKMLYCLFYLPAILVYFLKK